VQVEEVIEHLGVAVGRIEAEVLGEGVAEDSDPLLARRFVGCDLSMLPHGEAVVDDRVPLAGVRMLPGRSVVRYPGLDAEQVFPVATARGLLVAGDEDSQEKLAHGEPDPNRDQKENDAESESGAFLHANAG
jgi:hypothetical protein